MDVIYAHARLDDLDLDARSQSVGKGKHTNKISVECSRHLNKQEAFNLLEVGHYLRDFELDLEWDFAYVYQLGNSNRFPRGMQAVTESRYPTVINQSRSSSPLT